MDMHEVAEFTPAEGRKFGVTVGLAFLALATLLWFKENGSLTWKIFAGVGSTLVVAGLVLPAQLGPVYRGWMKFAQLISKVTTPIIMGIIYFGLFLVTGTIRRRMAGNAMVRTEENGSFWITRDVKRANLERQF
jgi:hypothetical protein